MTTVVKTRIVRIGNSQGVRIPKMLLDQTGLSEEVELAVEAGRIVIRASHSLREGWDKQFKLMAETGDDHLLDEETTPPSSQAWSD